MISFSKLVPFVLAGALALAAIPSPLGAGSQIQAAAPTQPAAAGTTCDPARSVQVSGTAVVHTAPDRALVRLGVQSTAATVDGVEAANSAAIQKVMKTLEQQGVRPADISTDIYVAEPVYEAYDSLFIKGYRINNEVAVTVRDVKQTSALISAALKAGANQINGVEFYTSELRKYRDQARDLAVTAAKEKANLLASAAGSKTGCVINITENTWSYYNGWWDSRSQNLWAQNAVQNVTPAGASGSAGDEPLNPGQISVNAQVTATFSLE